MQIFDINENEKNQFNFANFLKVYVHTHTPNYRIFCIIIRYKYVEVLKLVVWYKINHAINLKSKTIMFEFFHLSLAEITSCVLGKVKK